MVLSNTLEGSMQTSQTSGLVHRTWRLSFCTTFEQFYGRIDVKSTLFARTYLRNHISWRRKASVMTFATADGLLAKKENTKMTSTFVRRFPSSRFLSIPFFFHFTLPNQGILEFIFKIFSNQRDFSIIGLQNYWIIAILDSYFLENVTRGF